MGVVVMGAVLNDDRGVVVVMGAAKVDVFPNVNVGDVKVGAVVPKAVANVGVDVKVAAIGEVLKGALYVGAVKVLETKGEAPRDGTNDGVPNAVEVYPEDKKVGALVVVVPKVPKVDASPV